MTMMRGLGIGTQDSALRRRVTVDDITKECERIVARLDALNARRNRQIDDRRPTIFANNSEHAHRVAAINGKNREFWAALPAVRQ